MVKHSSDCGQLLLSVDDAFESPKRYSLDTKYFHTFDVMLKNAGLPAPRDGANDWKYIRIEYQLEQEVYFYLFCKAHSNIQPSFSPFSNYFSILFAPTSALTVQV
jgi:hypothetical protein